MVKSELIFPKWIFIFIYLDSDINLLCICKKHSLTYCYTHKIRALLIKKGFYKMIDNKCKITEKGKETKFLIEKIMRGF